MVQKNGLENKYNSIIILGATGSGKTNLSLLLAQNIPSEIVNADSIQIYKYLDIGTAKATLAERNIVPHHLIDIVLPTEEFSVSEYKEKALQVCSRIISDGKFPIIVGGTGFYIESLISNKSYGKSIKNNEIRAKYYQLAEDLGNEYVYNILKSIDLESATKIHQNDLKRVIRAIEIYECTGITKSQIEKKDKNNPEKTFLNPLIIGINLDREVLYQRINQRVDQMINNGLLQEVEALYKSGLPSNVQSLQGIGYKELYEYFDGKKDLYTAVENIKINTRHYAKRQITWFKQVENVNWFDLDKYSIKEIIDFIIEKIN